MQFRKLTVKKDDSGRRLDRIVKKLLPQKGAGDIFQAIRKGLVKVNEKKAPPSYTTKEGDLLLIAGFLFAQSDQPCTKDEGGSEKSGGLQIIFQNKNLLFINKEVGDSVQSSEFLQRVKDVSIIEESLSFTPAPLHRLDKNTSGLLAVSQSLLGAKWFSAGIREHSIKKFYYGIVEGSVTLGGLWEDEISSGLNAKTLASPLKKGILPGGQPVTLMEFQIFTGKKHQIRAQSAMHGHPLLYDSLYGAKNSNKGRFFLHAHRLEFPQNELGLPEVLEAPLPKDFLAAIDSIKEDAGQKN